MDLVDETDEERIDISGLTFANLRGRQDAAVVKSIRQLLEDLEAPPDAVAGFQSSI